MPMLGGLSKVMERLVSMQSPVCLLTGLKLTGEMLETTRRAAALLRMFPLGLLTSTVYEAASAAWAFVKANCALVAPGMGTPFLNHW